MKTNDLIKIRNEFLKEKDVIKTSIDNKISLNIDYYYRNLLDTCKYLLGSKIDTVMYLLTKESD